MPAAPASRAPRRRILLHSYYFPPIGGSGSRRPLRMAKHLLAFGYEAVVVTSAGAARDRWAPEDATLVRELPADVEVRRLPASSEPARSSVWRGRAERWLHLRSRWARWWIEESVRLGTAAGAGADLIYVWMQPYDSADAGVRLARDLDRPWVADLGDPWALDEMMVFPSAVHRRQALGQMRRLLASASAVVMSTPEAVVRLREGLPELASTPVVAIPNGFDANDFAGAIAPRDDGRFRVVHTGYLHTELGRTQRRWQGVRDVLGGSLGGLDIMTRSHVHLVDAINGLLEQRAELRDTVELHLAGVLTDADREVARRCPVAKVHGYLTHAESIELMRSADLLFLPMHNVPPGVRATIVPGKTYEYLASGRPILAAVPDGDARDILGAAGNAILVRPDDVEGMAVAIGAELARWQAGRPPGEPDPEVVSRFEYRRLAGELAAVFDSVLAAGERVHPEPRNPGAT